MQLQRWDSKFSPEETNVFARELASILLSRILDIETRGKLRDYIDRDDFLALSDFRIDYQAVTVGDAISIRQLQALFQKRRDLGDDVAREINALSTFREAELLCSESNHIFRSWSHGGFQFTKGVEAALFAAQRKIAKVLGDVPRLEDLHIRFGPGSTTTVPKRNASARTKLGAPFACSGDLSASVKECLEEMPAWIWGNNPPENQCETSLVTVEIHPGRLVFVPKDRKTFRAIGPEPMLNGMFQLGIGSYMAGRLKRFGVDITNQSRNAMLAREGSIHGGLATLDLSSASDCISIGLVEHLLPPDWYSFLSRFRTGLIEYHDSVIKLEKFSTMGNGFTFPLETLIFWALAQSVCESISEKAAISVYGDDIIIPTQRYDALVELLVATGFKVNTLKSFNTGPFRESCGADYLSGINIRPYYLRDRLTGESAFSCYNFFKRAYDSEICSVIQSFLSPAMILWGPDGYGDGHLVDDSPQLQTHPRNLSHGYRGGTFETYTWKKRRDFATQPGDFVLPCYSIYLAGGYSPGDVDRTSFETPVLPVNLWTADEVEKIPFRESTSAFAYRKGRLGVTTPGKQGYKRIKIYAFI